LATERSTRSSHRMRYGKEGMSLIWMPPDTTVPPFFVAARAAGTSAPTGAKISAASSGSGGGRSEPPAHSAPSERAQTCVPRLPGEPVTAAKILADVAAIFAAAAGPAEPGHTNPLADREAVYRFSLLEDGADDLVPEHQRQFRVRKLAVDDVQVGPANGTGPHR